MATVALTSVLGPTTGILPFIVLYHPLHDTYNIHTEVPFFILITVLLALVWSADRIATHGAQPEEGDNGATCRTWLLLTHLTLHFATWLGIVLLFDPESEVATGLHEPVGPCNVTVDLHTTSGKILKKNKYLCLEDYDEKYFDFQCLPPDKQPTHGSTWYTICGTPFENRVEYIVIMSVIAFVGLVVFYNFHIRSGPERMFSSDKRKEKLKEKSS